MNPRKQHILVVDDDPQIGELVREYLEQHGYVVSVARDGHQMWKQLKTATFDLIILDIMLPGEDGLSLCRKLREESDILIIILSAVGEETDRVVGLEVGADDYLAKPFSPRELLARTKALMRRTTGALAKKRQKKYLTRMPGIRFLDWILDRNKRCLITPDGISVPLSGGEYALLIAFVEHPHRVLSRDQLLDLTKGESVEFVDRAIDVQVGRLRKKIEKDPKNPEIIITVRGGGYQFATDAHILEEE